MSIAQPGFREVYIQPRQRFTETNWSTYRCRGDLSVPWRPVEYPACFPLSTFHLLQFQQPSNPSKLGLFHPSTKGMKRLRTVSNLQHVSSSRNNEFVRVEIPNSAVPVKRAKTSSFIVKPKEMKAFFGLLADELIQDFLEADSCIRISDKYLLAMVFVYFKRAFLSIREYTRSNFFVALYLANDVEEDDEDLKYEIFPWALGRKWKDKYPGFLTKRDRLFKRIGYRAIVSRRCCEEIMGLAPNNNHWSRERPVHHAGAIRNYMRDPDDDGYPRGPEASPRPCRECDLGDSQYDSASPSVTPWYISSSSDTSPWRPCHHHPPPLQDRFLNMQGLKKDLPKSEKTDDYDGDEEDEEDDVWPSSSLKEE